MQHKRNENGVLKLRWDECLYGELKYLSVWRVYWVRIHSKFSSMWINSNKTKNIDLKF